MLPDVVEGVREQTFGERVRAMRIERNLSQDGLATSLPKPKHLSWVSRVEKGTQDVLLSDIYGLAEVLKVDAGWLIHGDAEDTEFVARLRGLEPMIDPSGQRTVLATAEFQVEESKKRALAANLSDEEAELVALLRDAPDSLRAILEGARAQAQILQASDEQDQEAADRRREA